MPTFPPYGASCNWLGDVIVKPGETKRDTYELTDKNLFHVCFMRNALDIRAAYSNTTYCLGFIKYRDEIKVERRTAFCLHYDIETERFDMIGDPNYEYAD